MSTIATPTVGAVYNFKFQTEYSNFNGTYKVTGIMSYDEYLSNDGDIVSDFFTPNNQQAVADDEIANVRQSVIMKLDPPDEDDDGISKYAPLCYVSETPDFNVKKYQKFGMITYIGICEDPDVFNFMKNTVTEAVESTFGITPEPMFVVTGEEWLTETEYNNVLKERDDSKKKVLNYYSENLRLQKELSQYKTKLNEYEKLIINLQTQITNLKS